MRMKDKCPAGLWQFGKCAAAFCLSVMIAMGALLAACFAPQNKINENLLESAYGISMNAIPGREPFRRIIGQNCQPVILVLDKKLSKLFIAPQARQELMRRLLRQTAAKGRR